VKIRGSGGRSEAISEEKLEIENGLVPRNRDTC
jgi:hypothetical protein